MVINIIQLLIVSIMEFTVDFFVMLNFLSETAKKKKAATPVC